jgi:hypothetical protein
LFQGALQKQKSSATARVYSNEPESSTNEVKPVKP